MQSNPPASYSSKVANVVYLKDDHGRLQVVIPGDRMLDLNQLARQLNRKVVALSHAEVAQLRQSYGLKEFPAISRVTHMERLVDSNLMEQNELFTVSEDGHQWLRVPMDEFREFCIHAQTGDYTAPLIPEPRDQDSAKDLSDLHAALTLFTPLRIKQRLSETLDLPPLPETANRIIELRIDTNAGPAELAHAVELDPGLSAQVLNWARSPYYGVRGEIKTIEDAVVRVLGFDLVINLALGLSLGRSLSVPKEGPHGYSPYWQQSVVTATLCSELVHQMPPELRPNSGVAYLCGLMHNFGFLILGHVFPPQFALVNRHIEANPHINRMYIERHLLGMTREQISSALLEQWRMPDEVVTASRHQHNPFYEGDHNVYARLLYVATRSLRQQGFGDGPSEKIDDHQLLMLGLKPRTVHDVTVGILERLDQLQSLVQSLNRT